MASMMPDPGMMPPPDPGLMPPPDPGLMPPDPMAGGLPPGLPPDPAMGMPPGPPPEAMPGGQDMPQTAEDWIKLAIEAAKMAADADETDDIETGSVMKAIMELQKLLGGRQKEQEALMGGGPATKALSRAYGG